MKSQTIFTEKKNKVLFFHFLTERQLVSQKFVFEIIRVKVFFIVFKSEKISVVLFCIWEPRRAQLPALAFV